MGPDKLVITLSFLAIYDSGCEHTQISIFKAILYLGLITISSNAWHKKASLAARPLVFHAYRYTNQPKEQWAGTIGAGFELGMELTSDKPGMFRDFYYFDQILVRVYAAYPHPLAF